MLRVEQLRVEYDRTPVLRGIDLVVGGAEIVCVLGPSGGGKSTLLRAIAGLLEYEGHVGIGDRSVDGAAPDKRGLGMMFQDSLLFPHLDVAANVGFGIRPKDPRRVEQLLALVGLEDFGPRSVDTLSGGQAQRVALARALAPDPQVLLLDEPFGALDAVLKAELVLDVQRLLRAAGVTVLAVTHDRHEAFTIADRVAVLREGVLVQVGTPQRLWEDPVDAYVARLVGLSVLDGTPYPPDALRQKPGGRWSLEVTGHAFSAGRYLVTGTVAGETVTYVHEGSLPEVGAIIGLDPV